MAPNFYVEDPTRPAGIRVIGTTSLPVGQNVTVVGTMTTLSPSNERAIQLISISANAGENPLGALFATGKGIKLGINTTGLWMKTTGKILSTATGSS